MYKQCTELWPDRRTVQCSVVIVADLISHYSATVVQRTGPLHVCSANVQNIRDIFFHMLYSLLYRSETVWFCNNEKVR